MSEEEQTGIRSNEPRIGLYSAVLRNFLPEIPSVMSTAFTVITQQPSSELKALYATRLMPEGNISNPSRVFMAGYTIDKPLPPIVILDEEE